MRETGKRYTDEFKKMILEVYNTGKPVKEICEEYGINYASVNNWVNKAQGGSKKISSKPLIKVSKADRKTLKENENEILRLKKENERIAMENEILKKAIAIFTQEQKL